MDRRAKILDAIEPTMRVLELGAGYSPLAPKGEGWNTCTVDHAPREELVTKYASERDVDVTRIEEVDVVWNAGSLHEAVPTESYGTFDACIASHVLEHIPDPIGLFTSLDRLLAPTGVISLAIPDKRYCFDFFKPLTTTGELIEAHRRKASRHLLKTLFDQATSSISSRGDICWAPRPVTDITFLLSFGEAQAIMDSYDPSEAYVDGHAWHFTPSSFELVMLELRAVGVIGLAIAGSAPPDGCEFYVTLARSSEPSVAGEELQSRRLELMRQTLGEVREQADFLLGPVSRPRRRRMVRLKSTVRRLVPGL